MHTLLLTIELIFLIESAKRSKVESVAKVLDIINTAFTIKKDLPLDPVQPEQLSADLNRENFKLHDEVIHCY